MKSGSTLARLTAAVLIAGAGLLASAAIYAESTDTPAPPQDIRLDPQTGEVLDTPAAGSASESQPDDTPAEPAESRAWTNDEGTEMLTPAPGAAPATQAVRCADGTLRMGHAEHAPSQSEADALCARGMH